MQASRSKPVSRAWVFILVIWLASLACLASNRRATPAISILPTASESQPTGQETIFDCETDSVLCPQILIEGDQPASLPSGQPSPFRGFADPSIRQDPSSERLWMAYSWPNVHSLGNRQFVPSIDIHLAFSDDGGQTWRFDSVLWPSQEDVDPVSGEPGYTSHEVANLLPVYARNDDTWYGIRLDYFLPNDGGFKARRLSSFRLVIAQAHRLQDLGKVEAAVLGAARTDPNWNVDVNLASLAPELSKCEMWNEPALHFQDGELFLAARCLSFSVTDVPQIRNSDLVVFAARPTEHILDWQWRYVGRLASWAEAQDLGGEGLTQIDFAQGLDGKLLAILTPDDWDPTLKDFIHYGCRVVEVASLDPPGLSRDSNGRLKLRAVITASDQEPLGPGACAYEPTSTTGVVMTFRNKESNGFQAWLQETGISP
jgi:hypothetical protein